MFDLPADILPDSLNDDNNWLWLISLVTTLRIITQSGMILWFWVQPPQAWNFTQSVVLWYLGFGQICLY